MHCAPFWNCWSCARVAISTWWRSSRSSASARSSRWPPRCAPFALAHLLDAGLLGLTRAMNAQYNDLESMHVILKAGDRVDVDLSIDEDMCVLIVGGRAPAWRERCAWWHLPRRMAALHRTAYIGLVEATRLLLDARADVNNTRTAMHRSPLCLAAGELGRPARCMFPLLTRVPTRLRRDWELLDRLPSCRHRHESASSRLLSIVRAAKLLLEHGADPDIASTHNGGPLHRAGIYKHPTLWHLLVASGANVDAKDDQGAYHSVLHGGASDAHLQA
jgi:hypothetical protein